jgi:hypothetical protein
MTRILAAIALTLPLCANANNYGTPTLDGDARVSIHVGCKIERFGVAPWAPPGSEWTPERRLATQIALTQMGLPLASAYKATGAIEHDVPTTMLEASNLGATDRAGTTYSRFHTTFASRKNGRVTCLESRTDFPTDNRTEAARVWIVDGYTVGEFMRCGNVSVFFPGPLRSPYALRTYSVPEPSTFWLMALGVIGLICSRSRNR